MNPLLIARNLRTEYLKLLKTAFAPRQEELAEAFRAEIEKDGFLTREPFIALAQPFENARRSTCSHPRPAPASARSPSGPIATSPTPAAGFSRASPRSSPPGPARARPRRS